MDYRDKMEVDLIDLAKELLKKWKIILICATIGAILAGGYSYMRQEVVTDSVTDKGALIRTTGASLSVSDAAAAETAANEYLIYAREYANQLDYMENSPLMQLNGNKVGKLTAYYAVFGTGYVFDQYSEAEISVLESTDDLERLAGAEGILVNNTTDILAMLERMLLTNEKLSAVMGVVGNYYSEEQILELIQFDIKGKGLFTVSVLGLSEEESTQIIDIITEDIDSKAEKLKDIYNIDLIYIETSYNTGKDEDLIKKKQSEIEYLNTLRTDMNYIGTIITTNQKPYYTTLIELINDVYLKAEREDYTSALEAAEISNIEDLLDFETAEVSEMTERTIVRSISKKYVLIGVMIGMFIPIVIYALLYIMSGKVHTENDIRDMFRISVMGSLPLKKSNKFAEKLEIVAAEISVSATKSRVKKVYIISADTGIEITEIKESIKDRLSEINKDISFDISKNIFTDPEDIKRLSDADVAVLIERADASKVDDIARELELCNNCGVEVLGAVVVK